MASYLGSIAIGSIFAYLVMFCLYLVTERTNGLKNFEAILSVFCWVIGAASFYQTAIYADMHQLTSNPSVGEAFLSLTALILLGKALFYPSERYQGKNKRHLYVIDNKMNRK